MPADPALLYEIAPAKLNLALHVRERLADGYHRIETVFVFTEEGDRLGVTEGEGIALEITGPFAGALAGEPDNLVLRAARRLADAYSVVRGARLTLDKRLPVASGIGGGSADAAAALRLLARWWGLDAGEADLLDLASGLGADVPACLLGRPVRGDGRGDRLQDVSLGLGGTPVLLVNPNVPLSTAAVFRAWDGQDRGGLGDWRDGRNDLEAPAVALVPEIGRVLDALAGGDIARMSGSGATCFGLFADEDARDRAAASVRRTHPGWWVMATRLLA